MPSSATEDPSTPLVVGVDVGGTKILGRVIDSAEPTVAVAEHRVDTPSGADALVDAIAAVVDELDDHLLDDHRGRTGAVGVGIAGQITLGGVVRFSPNLPGLVDVDLGGLLGSRLGRPVSVDNDANCATWAEVRAGAAMGVDDVVLATLGTGIGGGVVLDGRVRRGANGFAGEPGHMIVDPDGPVCPCGQRGCWERYASGSGLGWLGREAVEAGRGAAMVALAGGATEDVRGEHVTAAARAGDAGALLVMDRFAWWVGLGLANIANLFDPSLMLIGGGLSAVSDLFLDGARHAANDLVVARGHRPALAVESACFGPEAGVIGAALIAADLLV